MLSFITALCVGGGGGVLVGGGGGWVYGCKYIYIYISIKHFIFIIVTYVPHVLYMIFVSFSSFVCCFLLLLLF